MCYEMPGCIVHTLIGYFVKIIAMDTLRAAVCSNWLPLLAFKKTVLSDCYFFECRCLVKTAEIKNDPCGYNSAFFCFDRFQFDF